MAEGERRVEIGFEGGLILVVRVAADQWAAIESGLGSAGPISFTGDDASYVVDASKVCYVKVETSIGRVGF